MEKCLKCKGDLIKKEDGIIEVRLPDDSYGIKEYTPEQKRLHKEVMKLITTKYIDMSADECMLVFARVYSSFVLGQLKEDNKIDVK